jgi:hypothetical protein
MFVLILTGIFTFLKKLSRLERPLGNKFSSPPICGGNDKSLAFLIMLFAAQPKEFFLDGLKKIEQRSQNNEAISVWSSEGNM